MNIPPDVARAQGKHGIKGAAHGTKGGRPRLDLTDDERAERRRQQHEAYRRGQGIQPKKAGQPKGRRRSLPNGNRSGTGGARGNKRGDSRPDQREDRLKDRCHRRSWVCPRWI